jgi:cation:H+ antiporter
MAAVLLMGLIRRETQGPAGIGAESVALLVLYAAGVAIVLSLG